MAERPECAVYEFLLSADLDGELHCAELQACVRRHLAGCLRCRETQRQFAALGAAMDQTAPPVPNEQKGRLIAALEGLRTEE